MKDNICIPKFILKEKISPNTKLVYALLFNKAGYEDNSEEAKPCRPAFSTSFRRSIKEELDISENTFHRAISKLKELGYIQFSEEEQEGTCFIETVYSVFYKNSNNELKEKTSTIDFSKEGGYVSINREFLSNKKATPAEKITLLKVKSQVMKGNSDSEMLYKKTFWTSIVTHFEDDINSFKRNIISLRNKGFISYSINSSNLHNEIHNIKIHTNGISVINKEETVQKEETISEKKTIPEEENNMQEDVSLKNALSIIEISNEPIEELIEEPITNINKKAKNAFDMAVEALHINLNAKSKTVSKEETVTDMSENVTKTVTEEKTKTVQENVTKTVSEEKKALDISDEELEEILKAV